MEIETTRPVQDVIEAIKFCKEHSDCKGCKYGDELEKCTVDEDILYYLKLYNFELTITCGTV